MLGLVVVRIMWLCLIIKVLDFFQGQVKKQGHNDVINS